MRFKKHFRHRLDVETLEAKRLLAGDVTASVVEGTLVIHGDAASNGVAVSAGDAVDAYVIVGLEAGDGATSINGVFDRAVVSGVTHGVRMAMGEGHDLANLFRANVRGNVAVAGGQGNDHVNIGGPQTDANHLNTVIHGSLIVDLGEGHDSLRVGGTGIARGLEAIGGIGNDYVAVVGSGVRGVIGVNTGAGSDHVHIERTLTTVARVRTGAGSDQVSLVDSVFAAIVVNTAEGNDEVGLAGVHARAARFQGGPGDDALHFHGPSQFGHLRISGFETVGGSNNVDWIFDGATDLGVDKLLLA